MKNIIDKLHDLIYPPKTLPLDEAGSTFLGGVRLRDVPENIDEFYRLLFARFRRRWGWMRWFGLNPSHFFSKERFVSYIEFQEGFTKRSGSFSELQNKFPIYKLVGLGNHTNQDDFIGAYKEKGLDGYFALMRSKSPEMFNTFHEWHKAYLPKKEKGRHTYIIGRSGCGKSELMKNIIIQDIAKNESSVILIEPGHDLAEEIARQKGLDKNRLVYIDCSLTPATPVINPFEFIGDRTDVMAIEKQSQVIRDAIVQMSTANGQPLTQQMQSILQPCLDIVMARGGTLYDIQRFVDDDARNEDLLELGKNHPKHGYFFEHRFNRSNLKASRDGIYQKLQEILNLSSVSGLFCGTSSIDLLKAIEEKKVIIFNLSKGHLGYYASVYIGRLMVGIIQNLIFQRATVDKKDRVPINLYIDEFHDYINKSVGEIFVQGRRYKVDLTVATQTVGQNMDSELANIVLSNTNIKFAGQNDYKNTRTMSNETGTELEVLQKLQVGDFLTRISNANSFVLSASSQHADDKTCISRDEWKGIFEEQVKKYYRPRSEGERTPAPPKETTKPKEGKKRQKGQPEQDGETFTPLYD